MERTSQARRNLSRQICRLVRRRDEAYYTADELKDAPAAKKSPLRRRMRMGRRTSTSSTIGMGRQAPRLLQQESRLHHAALARNEVISFVNPACMTSRITHSDHLGVPVPMSETRHVCLARRLTNYIPLLAILTPKKTATKILAGRSPHGR